MRKKFLATVTAAAVMTSMFASVAMADDEAWNKNGGTSTVKGDNTVIEPAIEVELPGDLAFGINPLKLDTDGDAATTDDQVQIVSSDYLVINYSEVPVAVTVATSATAKDGVTLATKGEYDTNTKELKAVDGTKSVFLLQMFPSAIASKEGEVSLTVGSVDTSKDTDADEAKAINASILGGTANEFILKLAVEKENSTANISGFRLGGAVDPQASFSEGDVTVTSVFTLKTLTDAQYKDGYESDTTNLTNADASVVTVKKTS
jgi:hypothetical protein